MEENNNFPKWIPKIAREKLEQIDSFISEVRILSIKVESLEEALEAKNDEIGQLNRKIEELNNVIGKLKSEIESSRNESNSRISTKTEYRSGSYPSIQRGIDSISEPTTALRISSNKSTVNASRTFYGMLNIDGMLEEVGDEYKDSVPFKATVIGDEGEVSFNMQCVANCINSLESDIIPYFDYSINNSGRPSKITPSNTSKIIRRGNAWEMKNRIKIVIS